jgi:EAL domain-containing protein (putative c-di-GMP-specific phosphodiesterase class I)
MGEGGIAFFSEEIEKEITNIAFIKGSIKVALERGEIFNFYQPIINLRDERVVGIEALVRWKHPQMGLIPPSHFIPVAEESGLILDIGRFVLERAVADLKALDDSGLGNLNLAVNFSAKQFLSEGLVENISRELEKNSLSPDRFTLEITESLAMKEPKTTKRILKELKELGIKVAIDDFGTGYSSMNYLIEFDVDKIKIDRSFVALMLENEKALGVVKTIVELSHSFGALALAEGIEREEQLHRLKLMGCDEGQGYLFSPPMDFNRLAEFLKNYKPML